MRRRHQDALQGITPRCLRSGGGAFGLGLAWTFNAPDHNYMKCAINTWAAQAGGDLNMCRMQENQCGRDQVDGHIHDRPRLMGSRGILFVALRTSTARATTSLSSQRRRSKEAAIRVCASRMWSSMR